ncbi:MAG TPA: hypothetical protein VHZ52_06040 [Acidobacteriaceae bacterium]|nr:hypothetical protein [Acidobacteriaceae bacterium]
MNDRLVLFALFAHVTAGAAGTGNSDGETAGVRAHDVVGDVVCFLLFRIVGMADGEFGLYDAAMEHLLHGGVADLLLQLQHGMHGLRGRSQGWRMGRVAGFGFGFCDALYRMFHATPRF